jgi:hypothetical protein
LQISGLRFVEAAHSLGLTFCNGPTAMDWPTHIAEVRRRGKKLAGMPLSMFGRGIGSAGYNVSTILYQAEFSGMPPAAAERELQRAVARLVVHGAAPEDQAPRRFASVAAELLAGSPKTGSFGVLPLQAHVRGRWAEWGARLLLGGDNIPWVRLGRALLHGATPPASAPPLALLEADPAVMTIVYFNII